LGGLIESWVKQTSKILGSFVRKTDILARVGGDEFFTILPNTRLELANLRAEKINERIKSSNLKQKGIDISIAIGTAAVSEKEESIMPAIKRADSSMYSNKRLIKESGGL